MPSAARWCASAAPPTGARNHCTSRPKVNGSSRSLVLLLQTERELLDALSEDERQILLELLHKVACARPH